jgi:hypothetical protein
VLNLIHATCRAAAVLLAVSSASVAVASPVWTLFGTEIDSDRLFTVNTATGGATTVGVLAGTQVEGIAFDPTLKKFWGLDNSNHTLLAISLNPFGWTLSQTLDLATYTNIARNPTTGDYYANLNVTTNSLVTIDPTTGDITPIGPTSYQSLFVQSLAFDADGRLFGIGINSQNEESLYQIDVLTGLVLSSVVISSDLTTPRFDNSLAIHPDTGAFYTVAAIDGGLYEVDPITGVATRIGWTGMRNVRSLDFADCSLFPGGGATGGCFPGPGPFPAPEPATLVLLGLGLTVLAFTRRQLARTAKREKR